MFSQSCKGSNLLNNTQEEYLRMHLLIIARDESLLQTDEYQESW